MDFILFLAVFFLLTFILGRILEKARIPWIFASLLIGMGLSLSNPFKDITDSASFLFFAELGMYFLLFIIGFELNFKQIFNQRKLIFKTTVGIIAAETILGSLAIHYLFNVSWPISVVVASSFSTVGEAILLPILDEFKLVKTRFGQIILGIGVLDDFVELITIVAVAIILGRSVGHSAENIWSNILLLGSLFIFMLIYNKLSKKIHSFKFKDIPSFFLFVIFFIFLFIGIGNLVESAALGALLAGIALKSLVPEDKLSFIDSEIRTMSYGLFAPVFFLWVGIHADLAFAIEYFYLVLILVSVTAVAKILTSYALLKRVMGARKSVILGISLTVKLSTSIVIIKLLFENQLIGQDLYSVLITSTALFSLFVPLLLAYLISKWKIGVKNKTKTN